MFGIVYQSIICSQIYRSCSDICYILQCTRTILSVNLNENNYTHTRKELTKVVCRYHEPVNIPCCGNCDPDDAEQSQACKDSECKYCMVSFDNLDNTQRLLLHWHTKLDHMGFNHLKDLTKHGFLP